MNFIDKEYQTSDYITFWGSKKRYDKYKDQCIDVKSVVTSNVATENNEDLVINYDSYIDRTEEYSDNTSLMLLKVLQRIGITSFAIAGFDGFKEQGSYFNENNYKEVRFSSKYDEINKAISKLLKKYADREFNKQVQNYEMFL